MYRAPPTERPYVCPQCLGVAWGPVAGGPATCARCRTTTTLPDRSFVLAARGALPMPSNDPERLARLRVQDGRPRTTPPTLAAVLGGDSVLPGREAEALTIWNHLRLRAAQGDVAASEDLSILTLMLGQLENETPGPELVAALPESALDAVVLPRHRQEQLGRLVRLAVARGDRARAVGLLGGMSPDAAELDADSEYRVSYALVAVMDRDGARVLALVGPRKDVVPIADSHDDMASVLRAHAYELVGDAATAGTTLRELSGPTVLAAMQSRFPALSLCARTAAAYVAASNEAAATRAASHAGFFGLLVGGIFAFMGLICVIAGVGASATHEAGFTGDNLVGTLIMGTVGGVLFLVGLVMVVTAIRAGRRARRVRLHGVSLSARIVGASPSGAEVNDVPVMRFTLQVAGPSGPYAATIERLAVPHEVAGLLGRQVRVRADPRQLTDVVLED